MRGLGCVSRARRTCWLAAAQQDSPANPAMWTPMPKHCSFRPQLALCSPLVLANICSRLQPRATADAGFCWCASRMTQDRVAAFLFKAGGVWLDGIRSVSCAGILDYCPAVCMQCVHVHVYSRPLPCQAYGWLLRLWTMLPHWPVDCNYAVTERLDVEAGPQGSHHSLSGAIEC